MATHLAAAALRLLEGSGGETHEDVAAHSEFGVHIDYEDLYDAFVFLVVIYLAGQVASRFLGMPGLVGEIVAGILLGPPLADFVPFAEAFVMIGELGYVPRMELSLCSSRVSVCLCLCCVSV
jgi:hypothetical protein